MAIDIKRYLTKKNLMLSAMGLAGVFLLLFSAKVITGDVTASSRKRYAEQKAGMPATPAKAAKASPPASPTATAAPKPNPSPGTKPDGAESFFPDAKARGAQEESTLSRKEIPGLVQTEKTPDLTTALPSATAVVPPVPNALYSQSLPNSQIAGAGATQLPRIAVSPERFLFNNQSPAAVNGKALMMSSRDPSASINTKTFCPQGESIVLATMSSASTRDAEIPIVAGVWKPFYFNGHKLLEVGDKLIGSASAGKVQGRATVTFQKIIFKDGRSLGIRAIGTDAEGNMGIPGVKVGDILLNSIGPILLDLAGAVIQSFEQSATTVTSSVPTISSVAGAVTGTTQTATQNAGQSAKNAAIAGGNSALNKISDLMANDLEENKPYLLVLPGTPCKALLVSPIDVSKASIGQ